MSGNFMKNYMNYFMRAMKYVRLFNPLWRGSLLPLGREAAPTHTPRFFRQFSVGAFGAAAQPSGSKLPRHRGLIE
ncbi:hypothetical protein DBR46_04465 [Pseudomonas sp. KBW05]|nr:hypothetical protein DBR46_04465 [Pseudomonas sp. KBW05]